MSQLCALCSANTSVNCWPLDILNLYKRSHNGCQVRLLQRINTQIPNRLVCLHRCQQCYAHQVPSIPDALEINLIPDIDTHTDTRCKAAIWVFFGDSCLYEVMGLFLALWSGLHPCLYAVPGLSLSTLGPPGPPLLICGFWGFSLHSRMGAEIRPVPATMAVRCGSSKESTHKFKLRTNLFVFIASNNAMLTRFPVSQYHHRHRHQQQRQQQQQHLNLTVVDGPYSKSLNSAVCTPVHIHGEKERPHSLMQTEKVL